MQVFFQIGSESQSLRVYSKKVLTVQGDIDIVLERFK
jgi:hypothetical protein